MPYQRIDVATQAPIGSPGPLPAELVGLDNDSLADLSWVDAALGYSGVGFTFVPDPPPTPPRRLIAKSVVQERVNTEGKLADVFALLKAPGNEIHYARWFAPDWPNVYFDDEGLLAMLAAAGCTAEQVARITA